MTDPVIILGAGMAGLTAARALQDAGQPVIVLEKGRGVGGRMATRRLGEAVCDHGAQFITAREPVFAERVRQWQAAGALVEWCRGFNGADDGHPRYRGRPSMTSTPKLLAAGLPVQLQQRATAIARDKTQWRVATEAGPVFTSTSLVLTPPVPQSLALLKAGGVELPGGIMNSLSAIRYEPCLAVMALLDGPAAVPAPGALQLEAGPVAWLADNHAKGISPIPCVTIHASGEFSSAHWDDDRDAVGRALIDAVRPWLGASRVQEFQVHGWRYSRPIQTLPERSILACENPGLVFAGDAFGDARRVEGAALSGLAAAEMVLAQTKNTGRA